MEQSSLQQTGRTTAVKQAKVTNQLTRREVNYDEYDDVWPTRMPSSARRYHSDVKAEIGHVPADVQSGPGGAIIMGSRRNAVPPRRTASRSTPPLLKAVREESPETEEIKPFLRSGRGALSVEQMPNVLLHMHWLVYLGAILLMMLLGWAVLSVVGNWWQVMQDDWQYGRPRTYQIDQAVGHSDSDQQPSHFIALNLNRHVQVIEFPGGDSARAKIYVGPILLGPGGDLAPVTLTFKDVNGDHKLDMIVSVQGNRFVFINDNGEFRPPRAGENFQP